MWAIAHVYLKFVGSGLYSGKIGGETSPSGASSYFSSSMQSAYGQQGKHIYNLKSSSMLKSVIFH